MFSNGFVKQQLQYLPNFMLEYTMGIPHNPIRAISKTPWKRCTLNINYCSLQQNRTSTISNLRHTVLQRSSYVLDVQVTRQMQQVNYGA